jgi:hypothetical protein
MPSTSWRPSAFPWQWPRRRTMPSFGRCCPASTWALRRGGARRQARSGHLPRSGAQAGDRPRPVPRLRGLARWRRLGEGCGHAMRGGPRRRCERGRALRRRARRAGGSRRLPDRLPRRPGSRAVATPGRRGAPFAGDPVAPDASLGGGPGPGAPNASAAPDPKTRCRARRSHSRATLPPRKPGSTIAEAGLNFRVRNGNGCGPRSVESGKNLCRDLSSKVVVAAHQRVLMNFARLRLAARAGKTGACGALGQSNSVEGSPRHRA